MAAMIDYPATIEVDLLFPRNETYNRNITTIPIVFAIQNGPAAYKTDWRLTWNISLATSNKSITSGTHFATASTSRVLPTRSNDFRYYYNDNIAIVPTYPERSFASLLRPGMYRLEWSYMVGPCIPEGSSGVRGPRVPVANGVHYYSLIDDGSGREFDIPLGDCPIYGDIWIRPTSGMGCPWTTSSDNAERNPCKALLQNQRQVDCIRDYFFKRDNETETCLTAFQRVTESWLDGESSGGESLDENKPDEEGAAQSCRPGRIGLIAAMSVAVAIVYS